MDERHPSSLRAWLARARERWTATSKRVWEIERQVAASRAVSEGFRDR